MSHRMGEGPDEALGALIFICEAWYGPLRVCVCYLRLHHIGCGCAIVGLHVAML